MVGQVKSHQRAQDHGEVFTNEREFNAILNAAFHPKGKGGSALRAQLVAQGKLLQQDNGLVVLQEDVMLTSPIAAAEFVFGGAINGRIYWKDSAGKSIKELYD